MNKEPNVLSVGYINYDEALNLDGELEEEKSTGVESNTKPGGGATNTALTLSSSPEVGDVYLAGSIGSGKRGQYISESLDSNGVELVVEPSDSIRTTKIRAIITDNKDPRYIHEDTEVETIMSDDISDSVWSRCDHLHITTFGRQKVRSFVDEAQRRDMSISLNPTQGYYDESYGDIVRDVDVVQMNRQESEHFRNENGPIGKIVDNSETDVVITHGPAGSTRYTTSGVQSHAGYPNAVDNVIDTIGAGDTFMAGYLSGWFDETVENPLRVANAYGAVSVKIAGAPNSVDPNEVNGIIDSEDNK